MTPAAAPILEIDRLGVRFETPFGSVEALRDISLSLASGAALGIVGESGSGKSTLGMACLDLLPANAEKSGEIRVGGQSLRGHGQNLRGRVAAMVFQNPMVSLNPYFTIGAQLSDIVRLRRGLDQVNALDIVRQRLSDVQLPDPGTQLRKFPHQLSGGQLQRVIIALAMSCEPKLLIADEPTTALDVTIQAEILSLLNELRVQKGLSLLFVSHDLAVVSKVADQVAVMQSGRIVESGPVATVLSKPKQDYTKALINAVPALGKHSAPAAPRELARDLLTVDRLSVSYGNGSRRFQALTHVSFRVRKGASVGVVGESGSGKSTLAQAIIGLVSPDSGSVHFDGLDLTRLRGRRKRSVAKRLNIVFQNPYGSLNPRMRVWKSVVEPLIVHEGLRGQSLKERCEALFRSVSLDPSLMDRYPVSLSGGQRQRVAIARAMALSPDLLILDEPTAALDVSVQAQVLTLMETLKDELGLSYLFISHDLAVVERMTDYLIVLQHGRIVEQGETKTVLKYPLTPYTQSLLAAVPTLPTAPVSP